MRRVLVPAVVALLAAPALAEAQTPEAGATSGAQQGPTGSPSSAGQSTPATLPPASPSSMAPAAMPAATPETPPPSTDVTNESVHPQPAPEDMENRTTPIVDLHGYLRTRFESFVNYSLGWENPTNIGITAGGTSLGQNPAYQSTYTGAHLPWYRNPDFTTVNCGPQPPYGQPLVANYCPNGWQTSANMRMRLDPEIHPTEFIAVYAQIDLLDNLVLGSTPSGYYNGVASPWAPLTNFSGTQIQPIFGYNGFAQSIAVKRAWAEVTNQNLGTIRFGRMPSQWGLGIFQNAGNGYDSDYQSTVDRIMYALRVRPWGLFFSAMYDYASTGPTSQNQMNDPGQGQPYDLSMYDDVREIVGAIGRRLEPQQIRAALARDEMVINGGLYFEWRWQGMTAENIGRTGGMSQIQACTGGGFATTCGQNYVRVDSNAYIPDLWLQLLGKDFRVELEAVYEYGQIRNLQLNGQNPGYTINAFGGALEAEYHALADRLNLEFRTGYASGDSNLNALNFQAGAQLPSTGNTYSLFAFHPDYRIDLIFWRSMMQQIAGAYYFRPSLGYNFIDEPGGDLLFGRVDVIWSRASEFMQTRGHHADLGVEIDATVQYQSNHHRNDGADPRPAPGFYANVQGGVFFPMGGLGPTDGERLTPGFSSFGFETAFTLRAFLGVLY